MWGAMTTIPMRLERLAQAADNLLARTAEAATIRDHALATPTRAPPQRLPPLILRDLLQFRFFPDFDRLSMQYGLKARSGEHLGGGDADGVQLPQVGEDGAVPGDGFEIGDQLQRRGQGRPRHQARQWQGPDDAIGARHRPSLHHVR